MRNDDQRTDERIGRRTKQARREDAWSALNALTWAVEAHTWLPAQRPWADRLVRSLQTLDVESARALDYLKLVRLQVGYEGAPELVSDLRRLEIAMRLLQS